MFSFFVVKFSIYLNRRVFVMVSNRPIYYSSLVSRLCLLSKTQDPVLFEEYILNTLGLTVDMQSKLYVFWTNVSDCTFSLVVF